MKIRVINQNDWERTYELDKSIIRVGSQISCDIQLTGNDIQPMLMQLVRAGGKEIKYVLRIFADNVKISRGEQSFTGQQMVPYDVLDGDKLIFGSYRMILSLEDEKTRVRASEHMEAKMYIQKRELAVDSPINGVLRLKNTGTEKACQFRLQIRGIPDECLTSAPLPYLYPGGKSTVGFMISHLQTKPSPGFHTVSIALSAPDDYFGEVLEFRQDIYVNPVFKNEIILEDDSAELSRFNRTQDTGSEQAAEPAPQPSVSYIQETARMMPGQPVIEKEESDLNTGKDPVVISGADNKNAFTGEDEDESENGNRRRKSNRKQKINVIRHDDNAFSDTFDDEAKPEETVTPEEKAERSEDMKEIIPDPEETRAFPETTEVAAEPADVPVKPRKSSGRKKKTAPVADEKTGPEPVTPAESVSQPKPKSVKPAEPEPQPEPESVTLAEPELQPESESITPAEPEIQPEPEPLRLEEAEENIPETEPVSEPAEMPADAGEEFETASETESDGAAEELPEPPADEATPEEDAELSMPEEEPSAEKTDAAQDGSGSETEDKEPAVGAGMNVIKGSDTAPIPVVHHSDMFDFAGEDEPSPSLSEKEPEVRFVKRGDFDD